MPIKFEAENSFYRDIKLRVDEYFNKTGRSRRDCPLMYLKTLIISVWAVSSYLLLVFAASALWQVLFLSVSLGLSIAAVGFNIQHDGGHNAYSRHAWLNRLMAMSLDLVGGSSHIWDRKHNSLHHTYANIHEHDDDIDIGWLGRFTPQQKRLWIHRAQHCYIWVIYGFLMIRWQLFDDFYQVIKGRIGSHRLARPQGWNLVVFVGGKLAFITLTFVIPVLVHSPGVVIAVYLLVFFIIGVLTSVVFQLAHVVEPAAFPEPDFQTGRVSNDWAVHQVETTVTFSQCHPLVSWYLGGLNFQVEHHLFPRVCHIHYSQLSKIVKLACVHHGLEYNDHGGFMAGVASHYRWLRIMGRGDEP